MIATAEQLQLNGHHSRADDVHPGMSRIEYERIAAVNYSTLKHLRRTPAHCYEYKNHPEEPTEALNFGAAVHAAILEPARFAAEWVAAPRCDRRTKIGKDTWKAFEDANPGKEILPSSDMDTLLAMQERCTHNQLVASLLGLPHASEVCVLWTDAKTRRRCKSLLDRIVRWQGADTVIDLKTCQDASWSAFAREVDRYGYAEQAATYLHGLDVALEPARRRFLWIALEKKRPFCAAVYEPTTAMLDAGLSDFRKHLNEYHRCDEDSYWPGYPPEARLVDVPAWKKESED